MEAIDYYKCGVGHFDKKELDQAIINFSLSVELDTNYVEAYIQRGFTYNKQGKWNLAIEDYNKAIELDPNRAKTYVRRGYCLDKLDMLDEAMADFSKAIELDPTDATAYQNRGNTYGRRNKLQQSISDLDRAIDLNPEFAHAYINRAVTWYHIGNVGQALDDINKALEINPSNVQALATRGGIYGKIGKLDQAIKDLDEAITIDPNYVTSYINRGQLLSLQGKFEQSIANYTQAIILDPTEPLIFHNRASVYRKIKDFKKSIEDYSKAIDLNPLFSDAYHDRGLVYDDINDSKKAVADFNQAIEISNTKPAYYYSRGWIYLKGQNPFLAEEDFVRSVGLLRQSHVEGEVLRIMLQTMLPFFNVTSTHPYLIKYLVSDYSIDNLISYSSLISQNQDQCAIIDRYKLYLTKVRVVDQTQFFEFASLRALIDFYMGDPGESLRQYDEMIKDELVLSLRDYYYYIRSASAYQEPHAKRQFIQDLALAQAETFIQEFNLKKASYSDFEDLYYAGQIFFLAESYLKAHHCFSQIVFLFPAAAYMQILTLEKLDRPTELETKVSHVRQWEASNSSNGFLQGFHPQRLDIEAVDFASPFYAYALHQELIDAIQFVLQAEDESFNAPTFWGAFTLSDIDFHQIRHRVLEKELVTLLEQSRELFSATYSEDEQLGWGADPEAIFRRLQAMSPEKIEDSLVKLIGEWRLRFQEYHFYIRYFYFNQSLTLWQAFSLLLYLEERHQNNRQQSGLVQEVGNKSIEELIKQLLQEPAVYVTAGAFSVAGTTMVAVGTTALAGTAIILLMKAIRDFSIQGNLSGIEAQNEYKRLKINLLERLSDTGEKLDLDSKALFVRHIKPVLDRELKSREVS